MGPLPTFKVALKCPCLHLPWAHWGQRFSVLAKAVGGRNVHFEGTFLENLPAAPETLVQFLDQRRFPGGGDGNPLQYSCLENPIDRGAWWVTVHGVAKSWIREKQLNIHTYTCILKTLQPNQI